ESAEADFLDRYLPKALSTDELVAIVDAQMTATEAELGAKPTMRQMGAIVKAVNAKVAGRADGKTVAGLVKARINS
ncbi:MAG: GatB/YqeY domain-containing protein, partial [Propionibacteriaceae bacterium]|nr:GatB/YqeY domain-containing protein [Propionibacteriaceae bacterium]